MYQLHYNSTTSNQQNVIHLENDYESWSSNINAIFSRMHLVCLSTSYLNLPQSPHKVYFKMIEFFEPFLNVY